MTSIYVIATSPEGPVKIGLSKQPSRRLKQLQTGHAETLILYHVEPVDEADVRLMEGIIHAENRHRRVSGEWFKLTVEDAILEVRHAIIRYQDSVEISSRRKL